MTRLRRLPLVALASLLVGFALLPLVVLGLAGGLPDADVRPTGIPLEALAKWRGPRFSLLWQPTNLILWQSLLRTTLVAVSVSLVASTMTMAGAYLVTRRRSRVSRRGLQFLSLAAYGLPSVFLLISFQPILMSLPLGPDGRVWLIHFLYILPMSAILTLGYAESHPHLLDRSAAIDGAGWGARLMLAYRANLWRGHLAVTSIGVLISWGDIVFSQQLLSGNSKLLVDLYVLRYFDNDSTSPDYASAATFSLVLAGIAVVLALIIAVTNRRGMTR